MWIADYRAANGLELDEFAMRVNWVGRKMNPPLYGTVSDTLIHMLEVMKNPRTHPRIADAIATVCGATSEHRDSIVDRKHHGTYTPVIITKKRSDRESWTEVEHRIGVGRPVVLVNRDGQELCRYSSAKDAARCDAHLSAKPIRARCMREVITELDNANVTYRYADEWDAMTQEERLRDIRGNGDGQGNGGMGVLPER